MKKSVIVIFSTILFPLTLFSQSDPDQRDSIPGKIRGDSRHRIKLYQVWLKQPDVAIQLKGALFETKDSSLLLSNSLNIKDYREGKYEVRQVDVRNINIIKIRKKGNIGKGTWIGAVSGFAVGGILGYWSYRTHPGSYTMDNPTTIALLITGACGIAGTCLGAALGSVKIRIPIQGSQAKFKYSSIKLKKHSIID